MCRPSDVGLSMMATSTASTTMMITGYGMPGNTMSGNPSEPMRTMQNSAPLPSSAKESPRPETGRAPVICNATPRATSIMPSVAMNGGNPMRVTNKPLNAPQIAPMITPPSMPIGTGTPAFTSNAATTPESASTDPTDRSIPPVMITQVAPTPRYAMDVTCNHTVMPLPSDMNALLVAENTTTSITRLPSAANFWIRSLRRSRARARSAWAVSVVISSMGDPS